MLIAVIVVGEYRPGKTEVSQKSTAAARVLCGHDVRTSQDLDGATRDVAEIANRSGNDMQHASSVNLITRVLRGGSGASIRSMERSAAPLLPLLVLLALGGCSSPQTDTSAQQGSAPVAVSPVTEPADRVDALLAGGRENFVRLLKKLAEQIVVRLCGAVPDGLPTQPKAAVAARRAAVPPFIP